jgi:hypothetical protein
MTIFALHEENKIIEGDDNGIYDSIGYNIS